VSSLEQNDERRILGQMVRFQNQAAVRIDNDCVKRREIALGGISPRNQGQEKEKKRLFHVPLLDIAVKPADASTDTANSDFTTQTFHLPGGKTRWMGLLEGAKTKTAKKVIRPSMSDAAECFSKALPYNLEQGGYGTKYATYAPVIKNDNFVITKCLA
jgi:hypothetical protein